jgi:uncharacterized protein (DUF1778 family)
MEDKYKARIDIVTTKSVKDALIKKAKEKNMTLSAFILQTALGNLK